MARPKSEAAVYGAVYLRLPAPLLETIRDLAYDERRPINTQIMILLERALEQQEKARQPATSQAS